MLSRASDFPFNPSLAFTTFTTRLACSDSSTTAFGISANISM